MRVEHTKRRLRKRQAGEHARLAGRDDSHGSRGRRNGREGRDVAGAAEILVERAPDRLVDQQRVEESGGHGCVLMNGPVRMRPPASAPSATPRASPRVGGSAARERDRGGIIGAQVPAAALAASEGGGGDQQSGSRHVAQGRSVGVALDARGFRAAPAHAIGIADDADMIGHDPSQIGDHLEPAGRRSGSAGAVRLGRVASAGGSSVSLSRSSGDTRGEHDGFQQRIGRQAVGAMHAGRRDLAGGPEAGQRGAAPLVREMPPMW